MLQQWLEIEFSIALGRGGLPEARKEQQGRMGLLC
jgi:hypothetical protein